MSRRQWLFIFIILAGLAGFVLSGAYAPLIDVVTPDMGDDFDSDGGIRVDNRMNQYVDVTLIVFDSHDDTRVWTENVTLYRETGSNDSAFVRWPQLPPGDYHIVAVANDNRSSPYEFSLDESGNDPDLVVWIKTDGSVDIQEMASRE